MGLPLAVPSQMGWGWRPGMHEHPGLQPCMYGPTSCGHGMARFYGPMTV